MTTGEDTHDSDNFTSLFLLPQLCNSPELDQYDPELIDGVRVRWISQGVAARDETAFSHALKIGHRLRKAGKRLTDAAIIDAYEHAYNVAQQQGSAGRDSEMPPMRDRQTMALGCDDSC